VVVEHDDGGGVLELVADELVAEAGVGLPLGVGLVAGLAVAVDHLLLQMQQADVAEHGPDAEVADLPGVVGRELATLPDEVPVEAEAHQQAEVGDGRAVLEHPIVVVVDLVHEQDRGRVGQQLLDEARDLSQVLLVGQLGGGGVLEAVERLAQVLGEGASVLEDPGIDVVVEHLESGVADDELSDAEILHTGDGSPAEAVARREQRAIRGLWVGDGQSQAHARLGVLQVNSQHPQLHFRGSVWRPSSEH